MVDKPLKMKGDENHAFRQAHAEKARDGFVGVLKAFRFHARQFSRNPRRAARISRTLDAREPLGYLGAARKGQKLRIISLASGSKGNAYVVQSNGTTVMVDAGLSGRELSRRLQLVGVMPESLAAVFLTHEHADHMRGAAVFARRHQVPIFATEGTLGTPCGRNRAVAEGTDRCEAMAPGQAATFGTLAVRSFSITHDATDPVGYVFEADGFRFTLAADLGVVTPAIVAELADADALLLESNHCPELLQRGPYPAWLKRRVAGDHGHLSNQQAAEAMRAAYRPTLRYLLLGHLSENNNTPRTAFDTMNAVLSALNAKIDLRICRQNQSGSWIDLQEEPTA